MMQGINAEPLTLGKAKAMVVCSSRAHAVRYFLEIKRYCQENNITDVNPMVAFSGTVSYEGVEYTETKLNSTGTDGLFRQVV